MLPAASGCRRGSCTQTGLRQPAVMAVMKVGSVWPARRRLCWSSPSHMLLLIITSQYVTTAAAAHLRCYLSGWPSSSRGPVANASFIVIEMKTNTRNKDCDSILC